MEPMKVVLAVLVVSVARASDIDTSATCAAGDGACSTVESDNKTLTKAPVMMQLAGEITKRAVSQKESEGRVEIGTANAVNDVKEKMKDERTSVTDFEGEMMDTKGGATAPEPKVSVHSDTLIKYPPGKVTIAWADFGRDAEAGVTEGKDVFYVDAGSSGNHLFAYLADGKWVTKEANYEAKCANTAFTNKGLAAMGLDRDECQPTFTYQTYDLGIKTHATWVHDEQSYDASKQPITWSAYHATTGDKDWWARYRKTIFGGLYDNWEKGVDDMEASKMVFSGNRDSWDSKSESWDKCQRQFANIQDIPIVATAGMRLISQKVNDKVWANICGKSIVIKKNKCPASVGEYGPRGTPMQFASAESGKCGTIPGTQEAFYEWGAHVSYQIKTGDRELTGTFTMGGASAQIAIPLVTGTDMDDFTALIAKVEIDSKFDCNKMRLPGTGKRAPWFNTKTSGEHCADDQNRCTQCLGDYISMKTYEEVKMEFPKGDVWNKFLLDGTTPRIKGLGLVSFLGLAGSGLVAGGGDQIKVWAAKEDECGATSITQFQACSNLLRKALQEDALWLHVTDHFSTHNKDVEAFAFDTKASDPNLVLKGLPNLATIPARPPGFNEAKEFDAAYRVQQELPELCKDNAWKKLGFGYGGQVNCIRAYWTSLYTTAFFAPSTPELGN